MDGIIQKGQPAFIGVWVDSIGATVSMLVLGTLQLTGAARYGMWFAGGLYLLTVQAPTIRFNIPLNNAVQTLDIDALDAPPPRLAERSRILGTAGTAFEPVQQSSLSLRCWCFRYYCVWKPCDTGRMMGVCTTKRRTLPTIKDATDPKGLTSITNDS